MNRDYALGSTDREHDRLVRQAALLAPCTERFFREAGIGPGQRVLETVVPFIALVGAWSRTPTDTASR